MNRMHIGGLVQQSKPEGERPGLIECELNDLLAIVCELEATAERLGKILAPVLLLPAQMVPSDPHPEPPEVALPEVGDRIRQARRTVGRAIKLLHQYEQHAEI